MSIKTILRTLAVLLVLSFCTFFIKTSPEVRAQDKFLAAGAANCDPSQYTYQKVLLGDTWWIFVYDCNGVIIYEYPDI